MNIKGYINILFIFLIITTLSFHIFGCKTRKSDVHTDKFLEVKDRISPLTYEIFLDIKNNITPFSFIYLVYQQNDGYYITQFQIPTGNISNTYYMNSFETFSGGLIKFHNDPTTIEKNEHGKQFSFDDVFLIINYLAQNHEYFFDGSEFSGLPIPYESTISDICNSNFNFILTFTDTDDGKDIWGIFKCLDEYPSPEHPLYGLFQILEEHFISQFEWS